MPRKRRPLDRTSAVRDARLIVIATEDSKATPAYFEAFTSTKYYPSTKVQVKVLAQKGTKSAPEHILKLLDDYSREYQIGETDELWLVIDVDRWGDEKLSQITSECLQKGYKSAISNPAIEVWFLLHLADVSQYTPAEQAEFFANQKDGTTRTRLEREIIELAGRYNKSSLNADDFLPQLTEAINRAKQIDINPADRWPQQLGTRVYLLAESILELTQS